MLGMALRVARAGEADHHVTTGRPEQEDFLVLSGEFIAIIEGEERRLHRWDFVHCPPGTKHAFVGVGDEPCVLLCASSRQFQKDGPWGYYCYDDTAESHNAASPEDTQDGEIAYARFPEPREAHYPEGLLPEAEARRADTVSASAEVPAPAAELSTRRSSVRSARGPGTLAQATDVERPFCIFDASFR